MFLHSYQCPFQSLKKKTDLEFMPNEFFQQVAIKKEKLKKNKEV
jgi:hypothetical protein